MTTTQILTKLLKQKHTTLIKDDNKKNNILLLECNKPIKNASYDENDYLARDIKSPSSKPVIIYIASGAIAPALNCTASTPL